MEVRCRLIFGFFNDREQAAGGAGRRLLGRNEAFHHRHRLRQALHLRYRCEFEASQRLLLKDAAEELLYLRPRARSPLSAQSDISE
jgi:hypothetical protein